MSAADLIGPLLETTLASSAAILVVLLSRRWLRKAFGPRLAYAVWWLVPVALFAVLLPAREAVGPAAAMLQIVPSAAVAATIEPSGFDFAPLTVAAWGLGVLLMSARLAMQQRGFTLRLGALRRRDDGSWQATTNAGLPAAIGLLRPRIVLPADFEARYGDAQRELMQLHERIHIERGDLHVNAVAALLRCLFWCNPLVHVAARHFRHDQELACDAAVVARHPQRRRAYGEAMLHTQLAAQPLPLGCHWGFSHPLRERIEMLKQNPKSTKRITAGAVLVGALAIATGATAWAVQPAQSSEPAKVDHVGAGSLDDESRRLNPPNYPGDAADNKVSGKVVLLIDIDTAGNPTHVEVEKSEPAGVFDASSIAAAYKWHFEPEVVDGVPVPSRVRVPISYEADGDPPASDDAGVGPTMPTTDRAPAYK